MTSQNVNLLFPVEHEPGLDQERIMLHHIPCESIAQNIKTWPRQVAEIQPPSNIQTRIDRITSPESDNIHNELSEACSQLKFDRWTRERAFSFLRQYQGFGTNKKGRFLHQHFGLTRNLLVGAFCRMAVMDGMSLSEVAGGLGLARKKLSRATKKLSKHLDVKMIRPTNDSILLRFSEKMHVCSKSSEIAKQILTNDKFIDRSHSIADTTRVCLALFLGTYLHGDGKQLKLRTIQDKTSICEATLRRSLKRMTVGLCCSDQIDDEDDDDFEHAPDRIEFERIELSDRARTTTHAGPLRVPKQYLSLIHI